MTTKRAKKAEPVPSEIEEILRRPYTRLVVLEEDGSCFRAEIVEFPGCLALGDDEVSALAHLKDVAESWIEAALEAGQTIPEPMDTSNSHSGKLVLRMSRSLHRRAALAASRDGISLNQLIVQALAEHVGSKRPSSGSLVINVMYKETSGHRLSGLEDRYAVPINYVETRTN